MFGFNRNVYLAISDAYLCQYNYYNNYYLDCTDGDIRVANGVSALEGRVEVCVDGVWGTVCDDLWGVEEASVACRQLGFSPDGRSMCGSVHL